jgi:hypothetical protein
VLLAGSASEGASGGGEANMGKRGIVFLTSNALIAFSGCATPERTNAVARLTESDVRPASLPTDLVGTWSGVFAPIGEGVFDSRKASGTMTLAINDNGTYTATERRGAATRNYSGVVVANGRTIKLRSSSGRLVSLRHRGNTLYGVVSDPVGEYPLQISFEKDSGAAASPPSAQSPRQ